MGGVGNPELRQGPAGADRPRRARGGPRSVPRRPGRRSLMAGPVGTDAFRRAAEAALDVQGVDGVEVVCMHEWGGLTRFAKSQIHQSTSREDTDVRVRVVTKGRVGVASTNDLSPEGASRAAKSAKEMAEVVAPDPL